MAGRWLRVDKLDQFGSGIANTSLTYRRPHRRRRTKSPGHRRFHAQGSLGRSLELQDRGDDQAADPNEFNPLIELWFKN
jgi:hypothetical protein